MITNAYVCRITALCFDPYRLYGIVQTIVWNSTDNCNPNMTSKLFKETHIYRKYQAFIPSHFAGNIYLINSLNCVLRYVGTIPRAVLDSITIFNP